VAQRVYIGDGVYASFDGFQFKLETERLDRVRQDLDVIYLDPDTFDALIAYRTRVYEEEEGT
jgi:hypothetical protein